MSSGSLRRLRRGPLTIVLLHEPRQPLRCSVQAPLSPEIHGESGLDSESGASGMPPPQCAAVPRKAVLLMFERISAAFTAW